MLSKYFFSLNSKKYTYFLVNEHHAQELNDFKHNSYEYSVSHTQIKKIYSDERILELWASSHYPSLHFRAVLHRNWEWRPGFNLGVPNISCVTLGKKLI